MTENNTKTYRDPIPDNFKTLEEFDEFWSTHSLADYEDVEKDVAFNISVTDDEVITLAPTVAEQLRERARLKGVSVEALVNTFLSEKLREAA